MEQLPLPQMIARMDGQRLRAYREYLDFYNGLQWQGTARRRERRLTFNYARVFVDKVTSYLMSGRTFSVPTDDADEAEQFLRRVYDENNLDQLDFDTEIDASVLGDGAYKVTWDPVDRRVRVTAPDVQGLFVWTRGDDPSRVWRVASRYNLSAEEVEMAYRSAQAGGTSAVSRSVGATAKSQAVVEAWTDGIFELWVGNDLVTSRPNPYGFIPFVIFPNLREPKRFWGVSDIPPLMEASRELNRAFSQLSTILELSGNPIAVLENVEEARDIAVQPGAVWELPERARAYLLDLLQGGGVKLHTDYIDLLYRALHDLAEAPRSAFGDNDRNLSGVALEMELHPLLQKVRRKRLIRGESYRRRNEMVLRILEQQGLGSFKPYRTEVAWGPILPQDRSRLVRDEQVLVASGLHSRRTAMVALGVSDPETEMQRQVAEDGLLAQKQASS